jgi:hypothetical protein
VRTVLFPCTFKAYVGRVLIIRIKPFSRLISLLLSNVLLQQKTGSLNWKSWLVCRLPTLTTWKLPFLILCVFVIDWSVSYQGGFQTGATPLVHGNPVFTWYSFCVLVVIFIIAVFIKYMWLNLESLVEVSRYWVPLNFSQIEFNAHTSKEVLKKERINYCYWRDRYCPFRHHVIVPCGSTENELLHTFAFCSFCA